MSAAADRKAQKEAYLAKLQAAKATAAAAPKAAPAQPIRPTFQNDAPEASERDSQLSDRNDKWDRRREQFKQHSSPPPGNSSNTHAGRGDGMRDDRPSLQATPPPQNNQLDEMRRQLGKGGDFMQQQQGQVCVRVCVCRGGGISCTTCNPISFLT